MMLYGSIMFLAVAVVAGLFGFTDVSGPALPVARIIFFAFLLLFGWTILSGRSNTRDAV